MRAVCLPNSKVIIGQPLSGFIGAAVEKFVGASVELPPQLFFGLFFHPFWVIIDEQGPRLLHEATFMAAMILDPQMAERLLEQRRAWGADKFDEVWEGIYMMAPLPNDEHQNLAGKFYAILEGLLDWQGLADVRAGVNLAGTTGEWTKNFRCPDVAVFLRDTQLITQAIMYQGVKEISQNNFGLVDNCKY